MVSKHEHSSIPAQRLYYILIIREHTHSLSHVLVTCFGNGWTDIAAFGDRITILGAFFARLAKFPDRSERNVLVLSTVSSEACGRTEFIRLATPMTLADRKRLCEGLASICVNYCETQRQWIGHLAVYV